MFKKATLICTVIGLVIVAWSGVASACGGFFCQQSPVDQTGERIVFTVDEENETITALIEILYQGSAEDFSWILPIPAPIDADALQVPENGAQVFNVLHGLTDVQFIAPELPQCAFFDDEEAMEDEEEAMEDESDAIEIFASGEVGPFGFDVIGSEDPAALVDWLRDNEYRVTRAMRPLIDVYTDQGFPFIAMRLLDGETSDSITPIEITYPGTEPMIPLQLTAVAALPNFPIWVWIFGEHRAVPNNFAEIEIATEEITFFPGANDYPFLLSQRADALGGQAFITEFAQEADSSMTNNQWIREQIEVAPYLTRLSMVIDPEEMTLDPTFGFDETLGDVSRQRDATGLTGLYSCERDNRNAEVPAGGFDAIDPTAGTGQVVAFTPEVPEREVAEDTNSVDGDTETESTEAAAGIIDGETSSTGIPTILLVVAGTVLLLGVGFAAGRNRSNT